MSGWPWWKWRPTCRQKWKAWSEQPFLGRFHHVDVDGNTCCLVKVLHHVIHDVYSMNGMSASTEFAEVLHECKCRDSCVKSLQVFNLLIPRLIDSHGEEAHGTNICRLVELVVLFAI